MRSLPWFENFVAKVGEVSTAFILVIIKIYQLAVSPLLGPRCRFYPSCSEYGKIALQKHGGIRGGKLLLKRLLKCHPGDPGGFDDVP